MDNLTAHHSAVICPIIVWAEHGRLFWALYYPVDDPIAFVFNRIQQRLTDYHYVLTDSDMFFNKQSIQLLQAYTSFKSISFIAATDVGL